jgi:alpha-ketoglutaric semialdehyde dehydrogenase
VRACLILVDLQHDFLTRAGLVPSPDSIIANVSKLLAAWRLADLPVAHVRTLVHADRDDRMPHWKAKHVWACVDSTPGAMAPPALAPIPGELVLDKTYFSPFLNPQLDAFLSPRAELCVVAGLYTHACVRATVLDAYQRGYAVWVASDAVASNDPLHAYLSRDYLVKRACQFIPVSDIASRLGLRTSISAPLSTTLPTVYAGGRWQVSDSPHSWTQHNPSDWSQTLSTFALGIEADVDRATCLAGARQPKWSRESWATRACRLRVWTETLRQRREQIIALLMLEIGKPRRDAESEFQYMFGLLHATANRPSTEQPELLAQGVHLRRHPLGVVGLITPWNNPLAIPIGKLAPALLHGNTVLWKPALPAPDLVMLILETLAEAGFPEDCVNVVLGDAATGQALVAHSGIAALSFTGSMASGRQIAALCVAQGKAIQAELGGNNGVVISAHCDLEAAAADLAVTAFSFAGQRCTAPRRLIVERDQYDIFLEHLLQQVGNLRLGLPPDAGTQIGPMISLERRSIIAAQIKDSLNQGGRVLLGGQIPKSFEHGCWFEPTVVAPGSHRDRIVREESFGPIVTVQRADDFDAAIELCNDVPQGLVASLYSTDLEQQRQFLRTAKAGVLRLNDVRSGIHPDAPFGGWKASGIGIPEHGRWDTEFYSRPQAVYFRPET